MKWPTIGLSWEAIDRNVGANPAAFTRRSASGNGW